MTTESDLAKPLKTWSHLAANRRRPTEYEIVSTNTLWNTPDHKLRWSQGSTTPIVQWRDKYRDGSPVKHHDWNAFRDPDQVIYRTYNLMQDGQETYVDGLLDEYSNNQHDATLSQTWLDMLQGLYTPARYLLHAVQMASGYLVGLAPSSTVANPLMFQCADQLRWLSRVAYRTAELAKTHPDRSFGKTERATWEDGPAWNGFLELVERGLVAWDWGEQFVVLNIILKPAIDEAFLKRFGRVARMNGDLLTGMLLDAQYHDSERSRRFTTALVKFICDTDAAPNHQIMTKWIEKWTPLGDRAIDAYCAGFDESSAAVKREAYAFRAGLGFG